MSTSAALDLLIGVVLVPSIVLASYLLYRQVRKGGSKERRVVQGMVAVILISVSILLSAFSSIPVEETTRKILALAFGLIGLAILALPDRRSRG